jgi:hypothetical protein
MRHHRGPAPVAVAATAAARRPFYIVNQHGGHVLEIHAGLTAAGTHCEVWRRRPDKAMHQLWHIDPVTGLIHSMINDFVLECKGIGERVTIGPHCAAPYQAWCVDGMRIINRQWPTECLEIRRGDVRDGADVILHRYEGKPWQHWIVEYC